MKQKRFGLMGASSVLMIFIVLCLTAFGVLSLVSARADLRLTDKALSAAEGYYAADARTEALLSAVDQRLSEARAALSGSIGTSEAEMPSEYTTLLRESLADMNEVRMENNRLYLTVSISDGREIRTELELFPPANSERYRVLSRRLYSAESGETEENGLNLWTGA